MVEALKLAKLLVLIIYLYYTVSNLSTVEFTTRIQNQKKRKKEAEQQEDEELVAFHCCLKTQITHSISNQFQFKNRKINLTNLKVSVIK